MKSIFKLVISLFNILKNFILIFKYKLSILSLRFEIYLIKIEYIILLNKVTYEIMFFYKYNKRVRKIISYIMTAKEIYYEIRDYVDDDGYLLKSNFSKFKTFHRNMYLFLGPFYILFFVTGIIPFIYLLFFIFFAVKYSLKYLSILGDIYMAYYYPTITEEGVAGTFSTTPVEGFMVNLFYIEYLIDEFSYGLKSLYFRADTYLFRMERRRKLEYKIFLLKVRIGNKYVEVAQRNIDKFDHFVLERFPELGYDFEVFLVSLIIKYHVYKRISRKKIRRIKKGVRYLLKIIIFFIKGYLGLFRILPKLIPRLPRITINLIKKLIKIAKKKKRLLKLKLKIYIKMQIFYIKFKIRKLYIYGLYFPYLNMIENTISLYYIIKYIIILTGKNIKGHFIMIIHPGFWDYIIYLYLDQLYDDIRADLFYAFPIYPLFHIVYLFLDILHFPRLFIRYSYIFIKEIIHATDYFFIGIYYHGLRFKGYIGFKTYELSYNIIVVLIKSLFWYIYFGLKYLNRKLYVKLTYFLEEPTLTYFRYGSLTERSLLYLDSSTSKGFGYRPSPQQAAREYLKLPYFYLIQNRRFVFNIYILSCKGICLRESFRRHKRHKRSIKEILYQLQFYIIYNKLYRYLLSFNKYLYKYPH